MAIYRLSSSTGIPFKTVPGSASLETIQDIIRQHSKDVQKLELGTYTIFPPLDPPPFRYDLGVTPTGIALMTAIPLTPESAPLQNNESWKQFFYNFSIGIDSRYITEKESYVVLGIEEKTRHRIKKSIFELIFWQEK